MKQKVTGPNSHIVPGDLVFTIDYSTPMWFMCPNDLEYVDVYAQKDMYAPLKAYTPCTVTAVVIDRIQGSKLLYVITAEGYGWVRAHDVAPFVTLKEPVV